jgi:hypothetical protein
MTGCHKCPEWVEGFVSEQPERSGGEESRGVPALNQTTGHWYSVAQVEKTLAVRAERSRASGEVEEQAGRESGGLRLRCATLRPNGTGINR